jgi:hypothetical protein
VVSLPGDGSVEVSVGVSGRTVIVRACGLLERWEHEIDLPFPVALGDVWAAPADNGIELRVALPAAAADVRRDQPLAARA